MTEFAHEASVDNYTIKVISTRAVVEEWLDKYARQLKGSKEAERLIKELEQLNNS